MQRRRFGNTALEVSAIALECGAQDNLERLLGFSLDQGITFFDVDATGNGRAQTLFANWVKSARVDRSKIQLGSKFGADAFSPMLMRGTLNQSLKHLGTEYLDLYTAENIKLPHFRDDLFEELNKAQAEGKIRLWGVSLGPGIGWREEGFKAMQDYDAKALQTIYSLFEQHPGYELCEMAKATKAGVIARIDDWDAFDPRKLARIEPIARAHDMTAPQLVCKWLLQANATLTSIISQLSNEREIREVCDSVLKSDLTLDERNKLAELYRSDFGLGADAHPRDLSSSVEPGGKVRSTYVPPPVLIA